MERQRSCVLPRRRAKWREHRSARGQLGGEHEQPAPRGACRPLRTLLAAPSPPVSGSSRGHLLQKASSTALTLAGGRTHACSAPGLILEPLDGFCGLATARRPLRWIRTHSSVSVPLRPLVPRTLSSCAHVLV